MQLLISIADDFRDQILSPVGWAAGGLLLVSLLVVPRVRRAVLGWIRRVLAFVWPTPRPAIRVDELAKLEGRSSASWIRDLAVFAPVVAACVVLINLATYFHGNVSAVLAVVSTVPFSTLVLALGQVLIYPVVFGMSIFGVVLAYGPTVSPDARRNMSPVLFLGLIVVASALSAFLALLVLVNALLYRSTMIKGRKPISLREWIRSDDEPTDSVLFGYWVEARALKGDRVQGQGAARSPYLNQRLKDLEILIADRRRQIARARRLRPHINAGQVALTSLVPILMTAFASPVLLGPRVEIKFISHHSVVGYVVKRETGDALVIPEKHPVVAFVPAARIRSVRVCEPSHSWLTTSLYGIRRTPKPDPTYPSELTLANCRG